MTTLDDAISYIKALNTAYSISSDGLISIHGPIICTDYNHGILRYHLGHADILKIDNCPHTVELLRLKTVGDVFLRSEMQLRAPALERASSFDLGNGASCIVTNLMHIENDVKLSINSAFVAPNLSNMDGEFIVEYPVVSGRPVINAPAVLHREDVQYLHDKPAIFTRRVKPRGGTPSPT